MIAAILFTVFIVLMVIGVPVGVALGIGGTVAIVMTNLDTPWYGLLTVPQNFYAGLAKYPLLAIPMFVLVGSIFDRSGVAKRLVDLLGREHDLSVLAALADREPERFGNGDRLALLLDVIIRQQQALRADSLALAGEVFSESARTESRIAALLWRHAGK